MAFKLNKKSSETIQEVQASPALTLAAGSHPPPVIAVILVNQESYFQILQFTGTEHVCTYAHQCKMAGCTWVGLFRRRKPFKFSMGAL